MGCGGRDRDREKGPVQETQKWNYITLSDFRTTSCWSSFSYWWLWTLVFITIAVYASDLFTAVNLMANNTFGSKVNPKIPFNVAKWIFFVCIILSYIIAIYDWVRAIRVIRRGSVAETYLDPLAVVLQSIRVNKKNEGYRRFLVFTELTRSKKGTDYIAFFVYFQFKGAFRIILAEGPRQVINGMTLWAVAKANVAVTGDHAAEAGRSVLEQFFVNVELLANENREQTITLGTMFFSLVIWSITAIGLIIAVLLYLVFLWHYIPKSDGRRLSNYCRRKVDSRLDRIVSKKVKQAIEKQESRWRKDEVRALKGSGGGLSQPTLPRIDRNSTFMSQGRPVLSRADTSSSFSTLPLYSRNGATTPGSDITRAPTLPNIDEDVPPVPTRPTPSRSTTVTSNNSDASSTHQPLISHAAGMGFDNGSSAHIDRRGVPHSQSSSITSPHDPNFPPEGIQRSWTNSSGRSAPAGAPGQPPRMYTPFDRPGTAPLRQPNYTPVAGMRAHPGQQRAYPPPSNLNGAHSRVPAYASAQQQQRTFTPPQSQPPAAAPYQYQNSAFAPSRGGTPASAARLYPYPSRQPSNSSSGSYDMSHVSPPPLPPAQQQQQPWRSESPMTRTASPYRAYSPAAAVQQQQQRYPQPGRRQPQSPDGYSQSDAMPAPLGGQRF